MVEYTLAQYILSGGAMLALSTSIIWVPLTGALILKKVRA